MRGLIYKEMAVFFKSLDKKVILLAIFAAVLILYNKNTNIYAGILLSVMSAATIGLQNTISFMGDEKTGWKKYQMAMPVNGFLVVTSKYISVVLTLVLSLASSILFNVVTGVISGSFNIMFFVLSAALSIIIPLSLNAICLPVTYWFGYGQTQVVWVIITLVTAGFVKYIEKGQGMDIINGNWITGMVMAVIASVVLFAVSIAVSIPGYERRK